VAVGEQAVDHVTADKSRSPSNENAQNNLPKKSDKSNEAILKFFFAALAAVLSALRG
jgi:hypothetical protein